MGHPNDEALRKKPRQIFHLFPDMKDRNPRDSGCKENVNAIWMRMRCLVIPMTFKMDIYDVDNSENLISELRSV